MKQFLTFLLCFCTLMTQVQRLVKDLNTGPKGSNPREFALGYQNQQPYWPKHDPTDKPVALSVGFEVPENKVFKAEIAGCN